MGIQGRVTTFFLCAVSSFALAQPTDKKLDSVPGEYIVKLKKNVEITSSMSLGLKLGSFVKRSIPEYRFVVVKRPVVENAESAIQFLQNNSAVEYAEPNIIYRIRQSPSDPDFSYSWGLHNTGQTDSEGVRGDAGVDIDAEKAWSLETGSQSTLIAVIDTGINYDHADLKNNLWVNYAEANGEIGLDDDSNGIIDDIHGANFSEPTNITGNPFDDNGHGTHCAGTIGAEGDNGIGIAGVNWKTKMMAVKFLASDGSGSLESAILALDYAIRMGAKILNNSWGSTQTSKALEEMVEETNRAGALFVAAAGNDSSDNDLNPSYPANYKSKNIISVAAINNKGHLAYFSNYGKNTVHIAAPGVNIYSTSNWDPYLTLSGTSMAAPYVTGVAGLLLSHEPNLTSRDLINRMVKTAKPLYSTMGKVISNGIVNAYNALNNQIAPGNPDDPSTWQSQSLQLSSEHPYQPDVKQEFEVGVSGASEIALYFEKFETEKNYDKVKLYDLEGNLVADMHGVLSETYSPVIKGDWVRVVLETDGSGNNYGFDITKISYR